MTYDDFKPFYERWIGCSSGAFVRKFLFSIFIGAFVLGVHYFGIGSKVFDNFGWILSLILMVASFSLFYATHTFRMLLPRLDTRLSETQQVMFLSDIQKYLNDKNFLMYGVSFGALNSIIGFSFGLPDLYDPELSTIILIFCYFLAGFVCGLALSGIVGVIRCISNIFVNETALLDYTSHDKCGGTQFIGWALLVFSMVTLSVGMLITLYISFTDWNDKTFAVNILYFSWIGLPYIASLIVLVVPALSINKLLTKYKLEQDKKLSDLINQIFHELESNEGTGERKAELYADYEFQTNMRKTLHEMRTWPFSIGTNSAYFISVGASVFSTASSIQSWLDLEGTVFS